MTKDVMRKLIKDWNMQIVTIEGEERIQARPRSQQELNKYGEWVKANKNVLIAEIKAIENERVEREAKIQAIEGLKELKAAIAAQEQYEYERQKRWESESLSSILPKPPQVDKENPYEDATTEDDSWDRFLLILNVEELKTKHPKAWAYIRAEGWANASHYAKAAAGRVALERIINGDDHDQVIAEMEAEWNAYTKQHIWD